MNKEKIQNHIEEKVLEKIEREKLSPKPRWEFLVKNGYFWALGIVTVTLGGLAVSASIFVFKNIHWELYEATHENIFTFTIEFLPIVWLTLFVLFLLFTNYLVYKTKHGYKYHIVFVASLAIIASIALGVVFAVLGYGQAIDDGFDGRIPLHHSIEMHNKIVWNNPLNGLLFGHVEMTEYNTFELKSPLGEVYKLKTEQLDDEMIDSLKEGGQIRMIGFETEDGFFVCGILPVHREKNESVQSEIFERKFMPIRSKECEGVRPYKRLLEAAY